MKSDFVCALIFAAAACGPTPAEAGGDPCPSCTSAPSGIALVGENVAGQPDTLTGRFQVVVRDLANVPVPGALVAIDFSGAPDLQIADQAGQHDPRLIVNCVTRTVSAYTDPNGVARFTILGRSRSGLGTSTAGAVRIFWDSMQITGSTFTCAAYDLDGAGGVAINDLSQWLLDFGGANTSQRGNYDLSTASPIIGINDLSVWLQVFGSARSSSSTTFCTP